jgi:hypothetical protein
MDWYLVMLHDWFGPFASRTAVGVCWFVAGCITAVLFFTTSRPLPRSTVLRQDPAWEYRFMCDGLGHRIAAVQVPTQPEDPKVPVTPCKIVFKNVANGVELAAINNFMSSRITWFWVDTKHGLLAIGSAAYRRVDLYSWPACVSLGIRLETGPCYHLAFSPDGMRVLTTANGGIKEWDRATGAEVGFWDPGRPRDEALSSPRLYYDHANQPKLIRITDTTIDRWDLRSGQTDFRLKPTCKIYNGDESWLFDLDIEHDLLACVLNDNEIGLWSLEDGKLLRSFRRPSGLGDLTFSPDARFLAFRCERNVNWKLQNCLYKVSPDLERLYIKSLYSTGIIALRDPFVGTNWAFPFSNYCEFADDYLRVDSSKAGELGYEYDLPPRWQLFTPWAWAALGAWVGLAVLWRRLRKRRPGPTTVA